ncbi:neuronal acetylcholine receptor subunit alpha-7 [Plutella xylostella]|uniref:neuronal acetylcholine receptor subunit alpha-7 n=1 Tax=Plutella xylostella TaxID=51655 RepID=UPI002032AB02|nr:neuronal acetylcholine receptor subunit alpha-7 [Plutella xylostella]
MPRALLLLLALAAPLARGDECPADRAPVETHEARLHRDLLCDYSPDFRPVRDHTTPVTVKVRFALKYISFDSQEETFTIHSWVALSWTDQFLGWEPAQYGGIAETQFESHEIWTPRLALFNADASKFNMDSFYVTCLATSAGAVTCVPALAHHAVCRAALRRWPYDKQNCTLFFGSWMHTGEQVNFTFYRNQPVVLDEAQDGPGWRLLTVAHRRLPGNYNNATYPMLKYTFVLQRESAGPAALVVAPAAAVALLTLLGPLLDARRPARLGLACFTLLAHFTFLSEIGYNLPKHSADTPVLLLFARDSMVLSLCGVAAALAGAALRGRGAGRGAAPGWLRAAVRLTARSPARYVVFTEWAAPGDDHKPLEADLTAADAATAAADDDWAQFADLFNSFVFFTTLLVYIILLCWYIPYSD